MARKILFGVFLVLVVAAFYAYAGEVKLTTYYPAPYGEYNRVVTKTLGVGDNDASGTITSADAPDPATKAGDVWIKGKVGIGTTTPTEKLEIVDDFDADLDLLTATGGRSNVSTFHFKRARGSSSAPENVVDRDELGGIDGMGYSDGRYTRAAEIGFRVDGVVGNVVPGQIYFMTKPVGYTGGEWPPIRMVIDSAGNVGIGTTTPAQKLEVAGITRLGVAGDATRAAEIYMSASNGNFGGNKFLLRFPSTIATSANDEMWIGIGGGSGSLRGGYVGHIQLVAENLHFNTANDSGPVGSRDGLTTFTGGVMIMANESALMVPRNVGNPTKPTRGTPATLNGCIYYNTTDNKFRGYENGAWKPFGGGLGAPDYDSGWRSWNSTNNNSATTVLTHNLGTTDVLVYLIARDTNNSPPVQVNMGIWQVGTDYNCFSLQNYPGYKSRYDTHVVIFWQQLTNTTITVSGILDPGTLGTQINDQFRLRMWKIQ